MSTLYVDNLEPNLGSQVEIPDFKPHAGMVIQQVSYHSDATWSTTSGNFSSTYAAVTITPSLRIVKCRYGFLGVCIIVAMLTTEGGKSAKMAQLSVTTITRICLHIGLGQHHGAIW